MEGLDFRDFAETVIPTPLKLISTLAELQIPNPKLIEGCFGGHENVATGLYTMFVRLPSSFVY